MNQDQKKYLEYKILRMMSAPIPNELFLILIEELNAQHRFKLLEEINDKKIEARYPSSVEGA